MNDAEILTAIFVVGATIGLVLAILFGVITVGVWAYRWWTPITIRDGSWYCTYWVNQHLIHVGGMRAQLREHVSEEVVQECHVSYRGVHLATLRNAGRRGLSEFPQTPCEIPQPPDQGEAVRAEIVLTPKRWQGRIVRRVVYPTVNINGNP